MHFYRKFWFHFFSWSYALFEFRNLAKMKDTTVFLVSATPLKPLNRISWNFVVIKDIMCTYAFLQEILIWSFWGAIYIPFFVRLPVTWNCHSLYTAFSSNVGAWGMWACSLFLSLYNFFNTIYVVYSIEFTIVSKQGCSYCNDFLLFCDMFYDFLNVKWQI